jgi:peptidoglycan/xylan/chitin deacetylase (PgdA/CDA1 family)
LERYDAKATFFCLGKNVVLYPEIFERILNNGHAVGNHTYNHLNCWQTDRKQYLSDIESCSRVFHSKFFRPPYGKLKPGVRSAIRKDYEIVMWDIMAYDFDQSVSPEDCARNVIEHVQPGSIIVFHDSLKAEKNLRKALPAVLEDFKRRGLQMKAL